MSSLVSLFNQALTAVGHGASVVDPEERSKEAEACRLWVAPARQAVFMAAHWPSLRRTAVLPLKATRDVTRVWQDGDPPEPFLYSFQLPSDCLQPQYLQDYTHFDLGADDDDALLYGQFPTAALNYTKDVDNPARWSPSLHRAVVYSLAACLCISRTGKEALFMRMQDLANQIIAGEATKIANSEATYGEAYPPSWRGTGWSMGASNTRYFFPVVQLNLGGL